MTISFFVATLAQVLMVAIIARALLSWFPPSPRLAPVTTFLDEATQPLLRPIQRHVPAFGGFDLSPMIAIFLISIGESLVLSLLAGH